MRHSAIPGRELLLRTVLVGSVCSALTSTIIAQEPARTASEQRAPAGPGTTALSPAPAKVDVKPVARDEEIRKRLQSVLDATDWFTDPQVRVEEGVVFLNGPVESDELKKWAGDLARNTQDVVAVANRMEVIEPSVWDFRPAWSGLLVLWRDFIRSLPFFVCTAHPGPVGGGRHAGHARSAGVPSPTDPREAPAQCDRARSGRAGFSLRHLHRSASLRPDPTGVDGGRRHRPGRSGRRHCVPGYHREFLASIFLSMQRPFETGDLVEVSGVTGYVQQLNVRTTILMTLDGNLVQIPNATVYKSNLRNFTTNANRRESFVVGIGYDDSINEAQEIARKVLADHPAVLNDPEPSVLADSLGKATVNLRVYFWLNGREHSWLKVRSSVIRLVKRRLSETRHLDARRGPRGRLPARRPRHHARREAGRPRPPVGQENSSPVESPHEELDAASTKAEAGLYSEAGVIKEQARQLQPLKDGENLLRRAAGIPSSEEQP